LEDQNESKKPPSGGVGGVLRRSFAMTGSCMSGYLLTFESGNLLIPYETDIRTATKKYSNLNAAMDRDQRGAVA
jgi:hypothetical protein